MLFIKTGLLTARSRRHVFSLIVFILLIALTSCESSLNDQLSYKNAKKDHMVHLTTLLKQRGILFESVDGTIQYNRSEKKEFNGAQSALASAASVKYVDPDVREHFHALLYIEGIEYIESDYEGNGWTLWWPGSEALKLNILDQVVEYKIKRQVEEDADCESGPHETVNKPSFVQDAIDRQAVRSRKDY